MKIGREGLLFLAIVVAFAILVSVLSFSIAYVHPFELSVRLFALNGFLTLSVATIMTPFLREVKNAFNTPFLKVHHSFAAIGITLMTLHPVAYAVQTLDATVFLPNLSSWYLFWLLGGRQAFLVVYVSVTAALLRRKITKYWRILHGLMYVSLFFAIIHANLIGIDFQNSLIRVIFDGLFAASVVTFGLKRLRNRQTRRVARA